MNLNKRSLRVVEALLAHAEERRVTAHPIERGGRFIDCGIAVPGGLAAGIDLARICLADLASVSITPGDIAGKPCPYVQVITDHPVRACLASQYAGWAISHGKYFAMGSGPMRAARCEEPVFAKIGGGEAAESVVGVLESRKTPSHEVVQLIATACKVPPSAVTLVVAPTASLAGGVQIVARSVETALHKLAEYDFPMGRIQAAHGSAPLPPVAANDLAAIGRTNDSILYGARVILYVNGDDASLEEIGPKIPSTSSRDHGEPFAKIFARYNNNFYDVDPHLFSPAEIVFQNLETGKVHAFGKLAPDVLLSSFFS